MKAAIEPHPDPLRHHTCLLCLSEDVLRREAHLAAFNVYPPARPLPLLSNCARHGR